MRTVNIAALKNNLSRYLHHVRQGEEILIRDRHIPVARIVPLSLTGDFDSEELALAAAGRLRLPSRRLPESFWTASSNASRMRLGRLARALVRDREDRDARVLGR